MILTNDHEYSAGTDMEEGSLSLFQGITRHPHGETELSHRTSIWIAGSLLEIWTWCLQIIRTERQLLCRCYFCKFLSPFSWTIKSYHSYLWNLNHTSFTGRTVWMFSKNKLYNSLDHSVSSFFFLTLSQPINKTPCTSSLWDLGGHI